MMIRVYYDGPVYENKFGELCDGYRAEKDDVVVAENWDDIVRLMGYLTQVLEYDVSEIEYCF